VLEPDKIEKRRTDIAVQLGTGLSVAEVSFQNDIDLSIIYRWLGEPDFVAIVDETRGSDLRKTYGAGAQALLDIIQDPTSTNRAKIDATNAIANLMGNEQKILGERLKNEKIVREINGDITDAPMINVIMPEQGAPNE
jgi:transposase